MDPELITRLIVSMTIILSGLAVWVAVNRLVLKRVGARVRNLQGYRAGYPAVLYFTTPTCAPCKSVQRPALAALKQRLGERLQVVEVDATQQPDLADAWGVMSVPTTFVIDAHGQPRHVNHGVATAEKLMMQLEELSR